MKSIPGDGLLHPAVLASLALLALNDHVLKHRWPGPVTGKLSDLAGLVLLPAVLVAALELTTRRLATRRALALACAVSALGFALVKSWSPATEAYRVVWAALQWPLRALRAGALVPLGRVSAVRDRSDLLALAATLIALWAGWRRAPHAAP